MEAVDLLKISEVARRTGVPIATLKFYIREGLIAPVRKSGRTMAWYHPSVVERVRSIRELQQSQFLPLEVIRETIDASDDADDDLAVTDAITAVLARHGGARSRSREELLERGAKAAELEWLERARLAVPDATDGRYRGDDLALLATLGAARRAGITADMLPFEILGDYLLAIRQLVEVELRMFRAGVIGRAKSDEIQALATVATQLSERLVVLLRRKLLLPTLQRLIAERAPPPTARPVARRRPRARAR